MTEEPSLRRFLEAMAEMHSSFSLDTTQQAVVQNTASLFAARGATLMLCSPGDNMLRISASYGLSSNYLEKGDIDPRKSLGETLDRQPVVISDVTTDPKIQYRQAAIDEGISSIIGLPVSVGSVLVGSLRLYFGQPKDFQPIELEYLYALPRQVGLALKKAFYFSSMQDAINELHRMPALDSFRQAVQTLVGITTKYSGARGAALLLVNKENQTLESVYSIGLSERYLKKGTLSLGRSLGEVTQGQPVIIADVDHDDRVQYRDEAQAENIKAIIGLPVWVGAEIAGVLRLYYSYNFLPDSDDMLWLQQLAHHAGMAFEKNQLLIQLKNRHDWYKDILQDMRI